MAVWIERFTGIIAFLMLLSLAESTASGARGQDSTRVKRAPATNIITDRLTSKDMRRWDAIRRIVFADDIEGQPLHPTLRRLWDQLEHSGHLIYIEMRNTGHANSNTAGVFHIEKLDPEGVRHVAIIRLYPDVIDRAYINPTSSRSDGFIPFLGLDKDERYVEVFGHELAHAVDILNNLARAKVVKEVVQETNEIFLSYGRQYGYATIAAEMRARLAVRDAILKELEEPADAAEKLVWREIKWSREARTRK